MAKWGKTDYKQLKRVQEKLQRLAETDFDRVCRELSQELAQRLLAKTIRRTPVGVKPKFLGEDKKALPKTQKVTGASGKKRSFLTREGAILDKYWSGYVGGRLRRGWTVGGVIKNGSTYEVEIINPVEYASYVEYGHRQRPGRYVPQIGKTLKRAWVPGRFMLTISERELEVDGPKIIEKRVMEALKEALDGN